MMVDNDDGDDDDDDDGDDDGDGDESRPHNALLWPHSPSDNQV